MTSATIAPDKTRARGDARCRESRARRASAARARRRVTRREANGHGEDGRAPSRALTVGGRVAAAPIAEVGIREERGEQVELHLDAERPEAGFAELAALDVVAREAEAEQQRREPKEEKTTTEKESLASDSVRYDDNR